MNRTASATTGSPLLSIRGLAHSFGGVQAVRGVDLDLGPGEICALVGENGAGKSTLMKAVAGALRPDAGEVLLDGAPLPAGDPGAVRRRGLSLLYQELNLVNSLPVRENITLGREPRRGIRIDSARARRESQELLERLGARIDPDALVGSLPVAEQQLVEIARALGVRTRVLILDEPTSALSDREAERLFDVVRSLAAGGAAIVYITHRLEEVFRLADRIVVMRDGAITADGPREDFDTASLVTAMVGRPLDGTFPERRRAPGEVRAEVRGLSVPPRVEHADLDVRSGEIVALTGLVGSGRTEVGRALFGAEPAAAGRMSLDGAPLRPRRPADAAAAGIGWVSEDRKAEGLVTSMSVLANLTLPHLARYSGRAGWIDRKAERGAAGDHVRRLGIRATGVDQEVSQLSGGNQQKVALARWMLHECRLLIADEPTRGVDVGGRFELYELLEGLARRGVGILMISSDLPEVLGMADRIVVMHEGRTVGELPAAVATQETILRLAMGEAA